MHAPRNIALAISTWLVVGFAPVAFAHEEAEILVGRTAAGELRVHLEFGQPVILPPSIFPGISGFAFGDLAFHSTVIDAPGEDFFQLSSAADFRFVLLGKDPGIEVWNDTGSGYLATNDTFYIGVAPFDAHPIWNIVAGTPGGIYTMTLKLRDLNSIYADSAPFVLSFTVPPDPPRLNLHQVNPQQAILSWPTNAVGWELQSATAATATNWTAVTNAASVVGTNSTLPINLMEPQRFFRLHQH